MKIPAGIGTLEGWNEALASKGLPLGPGRGSGPHVLNFDDDGPTPLLGIVPHRSELQGECLLVVGGDSSVEPDTKRFCPLSKNPFGIGG